MRTFAELGVSASVAETLAARDIRAPFKIQKLVMEDALDGRDILAKSQTGSGKTLAFGIPMVDRLGPNGHKPKGLVLVPTRELATQVTGEISDIAKARHLKVASVYGGVSIGEQARRASKAHIIVATPGRLQDLIDRRLISLKGVEILVLDEADRMLDMGFRPQVDSIVRHVPHDRQTMFFSATLDGEVGYLARSYTHDAASHEVESKSQTVEESEHKFVPVTRDNKVSTLIEILKEFTGTTLIFVRTKRGADRLAYRLRKNGVKAVPMHADLTQGARRKALDQLRSGRTNVLVATDVAARGLDLENIEHVINFDPPETVKDYLHRVGRTARAGRSGTGTTLVLPIQQGDVSRLAAQLKLHSQFEEHGMTVIPARTVFSSSKGRKSKSMMRPRAKRRI